MMSQRSIVSMVPALINVEIRLLDMWFDAGGCFHQVSFVTPDTGIYCKEELIKGTEGF